MLRLLFVLLLMSGCSGATEVDDAAGAAPLGEAGTAPSDEAQVSGAPSGGSGGATSSEAGGGGRYLVPPPASAGSSSGGTTTGEAGMSHGGAPPSSGGASVGGMHAGDAGSSGASGEAPEAEAGSAGAEGIAGTPNETCECADGQCCDGCHVRKSTYFCGERPRSTVCVESTRITEYWNLFCDGSHAGDCSRWGAKTKSVASNDDACP